MRLILIGCVLGADDGRLACAWRIRLEIGKKELQNDRGLQRGLAGEMAVELRIDRLDEFERGNDHL